VRIHGGEVQGRTGLAEEEYWPLQKRVRELLHILVMTHRRMLSRSSPEFRAYKGSNDHFEWLEHPGIDRFKNRLPMRIEDVGTLRMRKLVTLVGDRRDDKTFDLTPAGLRFHDQHCDQEGH
jgi:hypothetical protein